MYSNYNRDEEKVNYLLTNKKINDNYELFLREKDQWKTVKNEYF